MKTVLPAVSLSQLSGVSEMAVAAARVAARMVDFNIVRCAAMAIQWLVCFPQRAKSNNWATGG